MLDINFHRNLNCFKNVLKKFNGRAYFDHRPIEATIELDACLKDLGAIYMNQCTRFQYYNIVTTFPQFIWKC